MAKLPDLFVNAVATFDGKALAKGQKQIGGFEKGVKKFAKVFAAAFSVTAITAFGKASVKAFAEDEKAAAKLTRTVTNLGLGFENARITKFISDLEQTAAVSDDVLRPAFQSLLTTTGSVEKSQKLLALALDISAGSGEDVATVAGDLSSAYVGQTKSLSKYRLGLSKAELQGKSFAEIQELLNKQFSGQNSARLETYAGKMEALKVAAGNAQEIIGKGIVDALSKLGDDKSIENLAANMEKAAKSTADVIRGIGVLAAKLKTIPGFDSKDWEYVYNISYLKFLQDLGAADAIKPKPFTTPMTISGSTDLAVKEAKARAAAEAAAAKRAKELLALQKKAALVEKNKLSLSKAAAVFDTNRISIAAALRATYDKETILRLEALQAIEEDNGDLALKKINELAALQKNADMAKLAGITQISNATLEAINTQLLNELTAIDKSKMAETDKENARQIAFGKYNAAITAAGELAAKESYSERVQIQLTEIAKLASLSKTSNASLTLNKLRESEELAMIDRVAKAQKAADDARLSALQTYINALAKAGAGPSPNTAAIQKMTPSEAEIALAKEPVSVPTALTPAQISGIRYAAQAQDAYEKSLASISLTNAVAQGSLMQGLSSGLTLSAATSGARYAAQAAASYNITIEAGLGDPEAIARAVEDVLNQSSYRGTSVNRGSGDYLVA
jgi:hypothetical protein